jgi:hypothetical protein
MGKALEARRHGDRPRDDGDGTLRCGAGWAFIWVSGI